MVKASEILEIGEIEEDIVMELGLIIPLLCSEPPNQVVSYTQSA